MPILNDPTQFEQVDETCEFGGAVLYSESLGITAFLKMLCQVIMRHKNSNNFNLAWKTKKSGSSNTNVSFGFFNGVFFHLARR